MGATTSIPRVCHYVWLGSEPVPSNRQACIDSFTSLHPGWTVRIWDSIDGLPLRNQRAYDQAAKLAPPRRLGAPFQIASNVVRFEIMERYGGLYVDTDVTFLKPIDPLVERAEQAGKAGILGWEIEGRWLGEAVIAAVPDAAFMRKINTNLEAWAFRHAGKAATVTVGPQYITPLLRKSRELADVLVVPQVTFFPARHDQPALSDALASGGRAAHPATVCVHRFGTFRRNRGLQWA